ncbi:hypothetical protein DB347_03405 [Opitutaceae bacterium EW11]|nr:hypothetical protein DB347_03405 [Opitutaceae bacterium EW11]
MVRKDKQRRDLPRRTLVNTPPYAPISSAPVEDARGGIFCVGSALGSHTPAEHLASLIPVGIFACDAAGHITFFNRRAVELWGREPSIGKDDGSFCGAMRVWRLDGSVMGRMDTPPMQSILTGKRFRDQELIIERPDGSRLACSMSVEPQSDSTGAVAGVIAVIQDITERKRAEELLTRQADLLSQTHDAIFAWQWNGTIVFWNRGAERLYGYSATEALGRKTFELLKMEAPRDFDQLRYRLSRDGQCMEEMVQLARDGRRVTVESRLVLSRSFDAQPVVLETNRDISDRKRAEEDLREHARTLEAVNRDNANLYRAVQKELAEHKAAEEAVRQREAEFRLLAESLPLMVWITAPAGELVYVNSRWAEFTGCDLAATRGSGWSAALHPDDRERATSAWQKSVTEGVLFEAEYRLLRAADQEYVWHIARAIPVRDDAGAIVKWFGTSTDIDAQKRAEERLERAVKERTAKLRETVGELEAFSYSVSHDLRAPLRAMYGYSVALMEDAAERLSANEREYLARISRGAQRLDRLINDVLTYSRLARTDVRFDPVDLDRVLHEILLQYPSLQADRAEVRVCSPLGKVLGHEALVVQSVSNLMINAAKFVRPGERPVVTIWSEPRDERLRLWVQDNGIGISPHNLGRIFGMFQRLNPDSAYEGTGIGLSIVKKAVERMNGEVGVESEEGVGSKFWLELKRL